MPHRHHLIPVLPRRGRRVASAAVLVTALFALLVPASQAAAPIKVDFAPAGAQVPAGYVGDTGSAYTSARGYGWVRQDSLSGTHQGFDMSSRMRERDVVTDQRIDTIAQVQGAGVTAGAWETSVNNGSYRVTVGVGDASFFDSTNRIRVEGVTAVNAFVPTVKSRFASATVDVRVTDGRLTLDAIGGTNSKWTYVDVQVVSAIDTTPPANPTGLTAVGGDSSVALSWNANADGDLAGYYLYRSTSTPVPTNISSISGGLITSNTFTDTTAVNGTTYFYTVVAADASGNRSGKSVEATATPFAVGPQPTGNLVVSSSDPAPFADRLVFNRIGSLGSPPDNGVHDRATARLTNTGSSPLQVTALTVSGSFQVVGAPSLPATINPGATLNLQVRFVAVRGRVSTGSLTVASTDPISPNKVIQLAGYWQSISEGDQEPKLPEIAQVYGYRTTIVGPGQALNRGGRSELAGDEIISPYWERLNGAAPVGVTQLAAFHNQGNIATLSTFPRASRNSTTAVLTHAGIDGQSLLPHRNGSTTALATTTFVPPAAQFGWKIDSEWSDVRFNNATPDRALGCLTGCGHHLRFWPVKDRAGAVVPGSYLMSMDYSGINYDYQDNVYLITNVSPVPQPALPRVDVGSTTGYTDPGGNFWAPDTGLFGPDTAIVEGGTAGNIANTEADPLYSSYRAFIPNLPQDQRFLTFRIPEPGITTATVRLHYTERFWTAAKKRLFDLYVEGQTIKTNYDLFVETGGQNRAFVLQLPNVAIRDGYLDITEKALADYGALNAVEVIPTS